MTNFRMGRHGIIALKLVAVSALLAWIASRIDVGDVVESISRVSGVTWLVLVAVQFTVSFLLAVRLGILTGLPTRRALVLTIKSLFFRLSAPAQVGGDIYRVLALTEAMNISKTRATAVVLADLLIGAGALLVFAVVAVFAAGLGGRLLSAVHAAGYDQAHIIAVVAGALLLASAAAWTLRVSGRLRWFREELALAAEQIGIRRAIPAFLLSIVMYGLPAVMAYALMTDIAEPQLAAAIAVPPAVVIATLLFPISFSGIGVRETVGIVLYGAYGFAANEALLLSALPFVALLAVCLAGLILFLHGQWNSIRRGSG